MTTHSSAPRPTRIFASCASFRTTTLAFILIHCLFVAACGLERDGSHARSAEEGASAAATSAQQGRFQTEVVRLGVPRPLFLLIDTATGGVEQRLILSNQMFSAISDQPAPGADLDPKVAGRYDVKVTPGRRGSGLLRVDTATGKTWFLQLGGDRAQWAEIDRLVEHEASRSNRADQSMNGEEDYPDDSAAEVESSNSRPDAPTQPTIALAAFKEVLLDTSQDIQLRVWTAKQAAELYPADTAEMALNELNSDNPKILVAIANTVELDVEGRVRSALEGLASHSDAAVVKAVAERIGETP